MRRSHLASNLLLALVAAVALGSAAAARSGGHHHGKLDRLESSVGRLDIDSETREFAYAVIDEARQSQRALREVMRNEFATMRELMEEAEPDEESVLAQAEVLGGLHVESRKLELRAYLRVLAALDGESRDQLRSLVHGRGPGRGRSDGREVG